jgi:hypothetical protein
MIFGVEDKVDCNDSGADGHHGQDEVHEQHKPIHIIKLVRPEGCKYKVHFNENGSEWQYAGDRDYEPRGGVPHSIRDGSGEMVKGKMKESS